MLRREQFHFNMQSNDFLLVDDDDTNPQRINSWSVNYINESIIIPGTYKTYKQ